MNTKLNRLLVVIAALEAAVVVVLALKLSSLSEGTRAEPLGTTDPRADRASVNVSAYDEELRDAETKIMMLAEENARLSRELAEWKADRSERDSEVAFSYGNPAEAGKFVGRTFRRLFEAAKLTELSDAKDVLKQNEIDILSMGPFIQDAEALEADPVVFSQFQAAFVGEMLHLDQGRQQRLRDLLAETKTKASQFPTGSDSWNSLNQEATQDIIALLSNREQQQFKEQIAFISEYGALIIPTYSILSDPK